MKKISLITAIAVVALLGVNSVSFAQAKPRSHRVLIGFKDGIGQQDSGELSRAAAQRRKDWVRNAGGDVHHSFHLLPLVSAELPENLMAKLSDRPEIAYVEEDIIMHAIGQETPWGVQRIDAQSIWNTSTGAGVDVAILDTGIDYDHPDLVNNIAGGVNFVGQWRDGNTNNYYWNDINGHGSHCAGIVAASNNNIGVVGVAPGANLWAVKVLGDSGSGYTSDIIQGLEWCVDNGIEIASMSFGGGYSGSLKNACNAAYAADILLVAAAGNQYGGAVIYPAAYDSVIAVSATDNKGAIANFSSAGPEVELAAPGVSIKSTYRDGGYAFGSGTSMACPHVAGVAALVWAAGELGLATAAEVRARLQETAEDLGTPQKDKFYGYGLVDAAAAGSADVHDVAITAITAPTSAVIGEILTIVVTVKNVGNQDIGSAINVALNDATDRVEIGIQTIAGGLAAGVSTNVSFSWDTTSANADIDHTLTASHDLADDDPTNNSLSTEITIESAITDIAITVVDAPSPVVQGNLLDVSVTVENLGNQDVTSAIKVTLDDDTDDIEIGTKTISGGLASGAFITLTFSWDTTGAASGDYVLIASHSFVDDAAGNNSNSTIVTVNAAFMDIAITDISAPGSVVQGNVASVNVTVKNTGNQPVSNSIEVTLTDQTDGRPIGNQTIAGGLAAGNSTTVSFSWNTTNATPGVEHTVTANHNLADGDASNDSKNTVVAVQGKPATSAMHVGDITLEAELWSWPGWGTLSRITAIVPILDSSNAAVNAATVYGSWSGLYNRAVSGSTNSQGNVIFRTSWVFGNGTFTFTVNGVTKTGWTYDSDANVETSDSITVP